MGLFGVGMVSALLLVLAHAEATDPALPTLQQYFMGYSESVISMNVSKNNTVTVVQEFLDEEFQMLRINFNQDQSGIGPSSLVYDVKLGVQYAINRQFSNCTISSLYDHNSAHFHDDVIENSNGVLRLKSLKEQLMLTDNFNFRYKGVEIIRGIEVDTWMSPQNNFTNSRGNFTNTLLEVSFTRPGSSYHSVSSTTNDPVLIRYLVNGTLNLGTSSNVDIVMLVNYFGTSYVEPSIDEFDTSICTDPGEYQIVTLFVPGHENGVDFSVFRRNIRLAFSNYTGLYPQQFGSIEVLGENGTYIFVKLHISNVTSLSNVSDIKYADDAVQMLLDNSDKGRLPFSIDLRSGVKVTPLFRFHNEKDNCPRVNRTTVTITVIPTASTNPTSYPPVVCTPVYSTVIVTVTTSAPLSSCSLPLVTSTPSCTTVSTQGLRSGPAVGLAFGMFIAGVVCTVFLIAFVVLCRNRAHSRSWKPGRGYEKQRNDSTDHHVYFK